MKDKYYTGVGSRETPENIRSIINKLSLKLQEEGYVLRSGGADGADTFFEEKVVLKDIFIPWNDFNKVVHGVIPFETKFSHDILKEIHPAYDKLSQGAVKLHLRNVNQILGEHLDSPSSFLVCWAPVDKNNIPKGGTRTAWLVAKKYNIPCFNLFLKEDLIRIEKYIK